MNPDELTILKEMLTDLGGDAKIVLILWAIKGLLGSLITAAGVLGSFIIIGRFIQKISWTFSEDVHFARTAKSILKKSDLVVKNSWGDSNWKATLDNLDDVLSAATRKESA